MICHWWISICFVFVACDGNYDLRQRVCEKRSKKSFSFRLDCDTKMVQCLTFSGFICSGPRVRVR